MESLVAHPFYAMGGSATPAMTVAQSMLCMSIDL